MRLSTVVLPIYRWPETATVWRRAEALGFHAAYTYDHLSWRSFRDRPWFGAVPTLAAAAGVTRELRLGTLVASPNFRHPVPLAKDLMTLDDLSGGRLTVGIGAGAPGYDATVLGQSPWSPGERAERFAEFVSLLDRLLTGPATTWRGRHYAADEARMVPGCVQQPRVPLLVAAAGPRGMDLVAEFGQGWVTFGDPAGPEEQSADQALRAVGDQLTRLTAACTRRGREVGDLDRVLLHGLSTERPLDSVDAFVDWAGRYGELGITEVVIHWPVPDSVFASDMATFERIATEAPGQLAGGRCPPVP
jgi:alkanesulfonate monooxygenase SsuD/methylene tetrahydromethanopterin reductase-like flavin-dependent oxidoreductase (luciferase family)